VNRSVDRVWAYEVADLGVALPALLQLEAFPPVGSVDFAVALKWDGDRERCVVVVGGTRLLSSDATLIRRVLGGCGTPSRWSLAALRADPAPRFWASGSAATIIAAVNAELGFDHLAARLTPAAPVANPQEPAR
jgi:hypothetical protein